MFNLLQVWIIHLFALSSWKTTWAHGKPLDPNRPNVLYILTDQQRFDAIRRAQDDELAAAYKGQLKIRTPNLDNLSEQGAYFKNAYCQCPVCSPSRATLRTGCTIERTGVQTNLLSSEDVYEMMSIFKDKIEKLEGIDQILVEDYGYTSEYYGKWHIPDILYGERYNSTRPVIMFNDYDYKNDMFSFDFNSRWVKMFRRYLKYFEKQGNISNTFQYKQQKDQYSEYPYTPIQLDSRYGYPTNTNFTTNFTNFESGQSSIKGNYSLPIEYTPTYINGQVALRALDRLAEQNNSFLLTVGLHAPHPPMIPALKHLEYYWENRNDLFISPSINDSMTSNAYYKENSFEELRDHGYSNEEKVKEWIALYYAMVQEIDDEVGKLVQKLDEHGLSDNTMIVFTSDHGEMLGAHGMRGKSVFFEESVKVPLIVAFPGRIKKQTVVNEPVSHLDLVSTILDYLGAGEADNSDGTSLRRFIEKTSYNEYYDESVIVSEWDFSHPINDKDLSKGIDYKPAFLVRKGPYKLMMFKDSSSSKKDIMFDLRNDPYEMNNLLGNNGINASDEVIGKAEHLRCLLIEWMQRMDGNEHGYYSDPIYNAYAGQGDITEISKRLEWRATDIWIGDRTLQFGSAVWDGSNYVRNEYLYLGRRSEGNLHISSIDVAGEDASYFILDRNEAYITSGDYGRVKIGYKSPMLHQEPIIDAYVIILHNASLYNIIEVPIELAPLSPIPTTQPSPLIPTSSGESFIIETVKGLQITLHGVNIETGRRRVEKTVNSIKQENQQQEQESTIRQSDRPIYPLDSSTIQLWEAATKEYVELFYIHNSGAWNIGNITSGIQVTNQELLSDTGTTTAAAVRLTFNQVISYYKTRHTTIVKAEDIAVAPFSTEARRENYVRALKKAGTEGNNEAFSNLTSVSPVEAGSSNGNDRSLPLGTIIGIILGGIVIVILLVGVCFWCTKQRHGYRMHTSGSKPLHVQNDDTFDLDSSSQDESIVSSDAALQSNVQPPKKE